MRYCERSDLTDYLLPQYLAAVDAQDAERIDKTIHNITNEMTEALKAGGYDLPKETKDISPAIKRICSVLSAYRSVSAITSLVTTEAGSSNEFLPLQRMATVCDKELALIREGKITLTAATENLTLDNNIQELAIITRENSFNLDNY